MPVCFLADSGGEVPAGDAASHISSFYGDGIIDRTSLAACMYLCGGGCLLDLPLYFCHRSSPYLLRILFSSMPTTPSFVWSVRKCHNNSRSLLSSKSIRHMHLGALAKPWCQHLSSVLVRKFVIYPFLCVSWAQNYLRFELTYCLSVRPYDDHFWVNLGDRTLLTRVEVDRPLLCVGILLRVRQIVQTSVWRLLF